MVKTVCVLTFLTYSVSVSYTHLDVYKRQELIWGYEAEKRAKEFELNFLDKKIEKRKQELRELSEAVEKVRSILNKYTYRNGGY